MRCLENISKKMISVAKKRLGGKAELFQMPVEELKFKNKFDFIVNIDSFHHYANQEKVVVNFYRSLKRGGVLGIADFSFGKMGNYFFKNFEPANSRMLLKKEFYDLFERNNFKKIRQKRLGPFSILTLGEK